jgi:hypothetical protein
VLPAEGKALICYQVFKTSHSLGEVRDALPDRLPAEIESSLGIDHRSWLFTHRSDPTKPYNNGSFSRWANATLERAYGRPITCSTLEVCCVMCTLRQLKSHTMFQSQNCPLQKQAAWHQSGDDAHHSHIPTVSVYTGRDNEAVSSQHETCAPCAASNAYRTCSCGLTWHVRLFHGLFVCCPVLRTLSLLAC